MNAVQYVDICILCILFLHKSELAAIKNGEKVAASKSTDEDIYESREDRFRRALDLYNVTFHNSCPPGGSPYEAFNQQYYDCTGSYVYHCRLNENHVSVDGCAEERNCSSGQEAKLYPIEKLDRHYYVHCDPCRKAYYNDKKHSSTSKVICEPIQSCEGEYSICENGTSSSDARCTCNHRESMKPVDAEENCPSNRKPYCEFYKCPTGQILGGFPDFQCIRDEAFTTPTTKKPDITDEPSKSTTKSSEKPVVTNTLPSTNHSTVKTTTRGPSQGEDNKNPGLIIGITVPAFVIAILICLIWNRIKERNRRGDSPNGSSARERIGMLPNPGTSTSGDGRPQFYVQEVLEKYPDLCKQVLETVKEHILNNLDVQDYIHMYRERYGGDSLNCDLRVNAEPNPDEIDRILEEASKNGVEGYMKCRSCIPASILENVMQEETNLCQFITKREEIIEANRNILNPRVCKVVLNALKDIPNGDFDVKEYINNHRKFFGDDSVSDDLEGIYTQANQGEADNTELCGRILEVASKNGVEGYQRFIFCIPEDILESVLEVENKYTTKNELIRRNKEILENVPGCCDKILNMVEKSVCKDLYPDVYTGNYKEQYADKMSDTETTVMDILDDMHSNNTLRTDQNKEILRLAKRTGVEGYFRFKSCLPEHLLDSVEEAEETMVNNIENGQLS